MHKNDAIRLQHMLDAAREALSFAAGRSISDLDSNRMFVLSLIKSIEVIGEAASKVSVEGRSECPGIPWRGILPPCVIVSSTPTSTLTWTSFGVRSRKNCARLLLNWNRHWPRWNEDHSALKG